MGGLAKVEVRGSALRVSIPKNPALATLGCQLAGWKVAEGCYASGPARILARKPRELYEKVGYSEESKKAAVVIECERLPTNETLNKIRSACGAHELACACFKPDSEGGIINILARVVEMAFFRLDYLGYDTRKIVKASGTVPCGARTPEDANDSIIYSGSVSLETHDWNESLTKKCISSASRLHGRRFADVLAEAGGDFMKVDFDYYAPAMTRVVDKQSGRTYSAGRMQ
jgi:methenyltetrahydromethanopterin cyclohydrolase